MWHIIRQDTTKGTTEQESIEGVMETTKAVRLTRDQIDSLASGLGSGKRNFKLKERYRRDYPTERRTSVEDIYLETRNFKVEKLKRDAREGVHTTDVCDNA